METNLDKALRRKMEISEERRRDYVGNLVMSWFKDNNDGEISVYEIAKMCEMPIPYAMIIEAMEDLIAENRVIMWRESARLGQITYKFKFPLYK